MARYDADKIREKVTSDCERLFASHSSNRPEGWVCDQRTKDVVCLGYWLNEELTMVGIDDVARIVQLGTFNRYSRSDHDIWLLAAQIMNDVVEGNVDRSRKTHRRWG